MTTCAQCGQEHDEELAACPACGEPAGETTESFAPIRGVELELGEAPLSAEGPLLVVRKGPDVGETFYLDRPELTIGRDPECDIFLNDVTVSRTHAMLRILGGDVTVEDGDSLNGTYVNDVLVDRARLSSGDALQVGRFQMVFLAGGEG
jgi:pSer/pThr/pTyr-binding forkhead associated (FHA) protein